MPSNGPAMVSTPATHRRIIILDRNTSRRKCFELKNSATSCPLPSNSSQGRALNQVNTDQAGQDVNSDPTFPSRCACNRRTHLLYPRPCGHFTVHCFPSPTWPASDFCVRSSTGQGCSFLSLSLQLLVSVTKSSPCHPLAEAPPSKFSASSSLTLFQYLPSPGVLRCARSPGTWELGG